MNGSSSQAPALVLLLVFALGIVPSAPCVEMVSEGPFRRLVAAEEELLGLRKDAIGALRGFEEAQGKLAPGVGETSPAFLEARRRFDEASGRYFEAYDELSRAKNETVLFHARERVMTLVGEMEGEGRSVDALRRGLAELDVALKSYYEVRRHEGIHFHDSLRTGALRRCYAVVQSLADELGSLRDDASWGERLKTRIAALWTRLCRVVRLGRILLAGAPALGRTARALFDPVRGGDLGKAIMAMYERLGQAAGLRVRAERRGTLVAGRPVIYAITHRHYMGDHMAAFSAVGPREATIVADAAGYGMPKGLRRALNRNEGIAPVGHPRIDPVARIADGLARTGCVLIYPEGSTATPLGETRPIRPNFEAALLPRLLEGGSFQIVPVTIDDVALRFGADFHGMKWEKEARVVFHEPIQSEEIARDHAIDSLTELTARRIRLAWHEVLGSREAAAGQLSTEAFLEAMDERLGNPRRGPEAKELLPGFEEIEGRREEGGGIPFETISTAKGARMVDRLVGEARRALLLGRDEAESLMNLAAEAEKRLAAGEPASREELARRLTEIGFDASRVEEIVAEEACHEPTRRARRIREIRRGIARAR